MSRLAASFAIACAIGWPARAAAGDPAPGVAAVGAQMGGSGGIGFGRPEQAVDAELRSAGWQPLPAPGAEFRVSFGLTVYDVFLDIHFGGSDASLDGPSGESDRGEYHRGAIGVDLGYRLRLGRSLTLSPTIGVSSLTTTLCFDGQPDASSSPSRPPFEQIIRNPGRNTCLEAGAVGLDAGLAFSWDLRLARIQRAGSSPITVKLGIGPRVGYTLALSAARTWETGPTSELLSELPRFDGPIAPLGGGYAGLEAQLRFALEDGV